VSAIRITVARTAGSAPREAGTQMLVWPDRTEGTIGGGALEWQAMQEARAMLAEGRARTSGPSPSAPTLASAAAGR
jgi:xanthine dehydrogenase accessory factor